MTHCKYFRTVVSNIFVDAPTILLVSGAVSDLDSLLGELESLSVECKERRGMEAEEEGGGKDAGLEVELDDLTEKLRHALDTGEEITSTLGKTPGWLHLSS